MGNIIIWEVGEEGGKGWEKKVSSVTDKGEMLNGTLDRCYFVLLDLVRGVAGEG